ncbi:hypothetical protein Pint_25605 [Pistacia integerrima]|uniref:Uncharacterized protein n=1 Tax=Pistacia integerrima TaxID=434235 RepID=A0ACC0YFL6_9ROSI|nr:hypothetical protein Pint_25605 [Pistacia integerrima]
MEIELSTVICDSYSTTIIHNSSSTTAGYRLPPPLATDIRDSSSTTTNYPLQTHTFQATNLSSSTTTNLSFSKWEGVGLVVFGLFHGAFGRDLSLGVVVCGLCGWWLGGVFGAGVVGLEVGFVGGGEGCIEADATGQWAILAAFLLLAIHSCCCVVAWMCFLGSCLVATAVLLAVVYIWLSCFLLLGGVPYLFRAVLSFAEYRKMVEKLYKPPSA